MNKFYFFILFGAVVCGAYICGANIADAKCRAQIAQQNATALQNFQNQITQSKRSNHEIVYKTTVRDIRNILRDKYTIAE